MADLNSKFYSAFTGEQIDQAYEAIKNLTTTSRNRILYVTNEPGQIRQGVVFGSYDIDPSNLAIKPSGSNGHIVTTDAEGNLITSEKALSDLMPQMSNGNVGNLVKIGIVDDHFILQDSTFSADDLATYPATFERITQEMEELSEATEQTLERMETLADNVTTFMDEVAEGLYTKVVAYKVKGEPIDDVVYFDDGVEGMQTPVEAEDENGIITTVTGFLYFADDHIYADLYDYALQKPVIDAGSLLKPEEGYWNGYAGKVPIWSSKGNLGSSNVSGVDLEQLFTRVLAIEQVINKLKSEGIRYIASDVSYSGVINAFEGSTNIGQISAEDESSVDLGDITEYNGVGTVQLYAFDSDNPIYPVS